MPGAIAKITCGGCGKSVAWKPEYAGKRLRCKCGFTIVGPQAAPAGAAAQPAARQPSMAATAPRTSVAPKPAPPPKTAASPASGGDDFASLMAEAEEYALTDEAPKRERPATARAAVVAAGPAGRKAAVGGAPLPPLPPVSGPGRTATMPRKPPAGAKATPASSAGAVSWNSARAVRGIINIVFGTVFIVGGLTGYLALIGTSSGFALAVVGALLIAWGVYRIATSRG